MAMSKNMQELYKKMQNLNQRIKDLEDYKIMFKKYEIVIRELGKNQKELATRLDNATQDRLNLLKLIKQKDIEMGNY